MAADSKRVLLVEDNPGDADLVRIALTGDGVSLGLELEHVTSVAAALRALAHKQFDVVLLDLGLPDADGLDGLERLRAARPDTPIVVLTGLSGSRVGVAALQKGAQDYIIKGWADGAAVAARLSRAIERGRMKLDLASAAKDLQTAGDRLRKIGPDPKRRL
jgi:CheY-like chemotaxis protein